MKNISLILNIVLFVAVIFLYIKVYSGKETAPVVVSSASKEEASVVFVNADTLMDNFPLLKDLEKQFDNKRDSIDRILASRDKSLKAEYQAFEERARGLTEQQQQAEYENFMRKQQDLVNLRDNLLKKLGDDQEAMQDSVHNSLVKYLQQYNKSKGYDFILGYQRGSGILLANDSLDVTDEVLNVLK